LGCDEDSDCGKWDNVVCINYVNCDFKKEKKPQFNSIRLMTRKLMQKRDKHPDLLTQFVVI
jgi:hypothetical protein